MKNKQEYISPEIELVSLDNTFSLQLSSDTNPLGEPDWTSKVNESFSTDVLMTS